MNKKVEVVFSPEAEEVYNYLNKEAPKSKIERSILNAIEKKKELIKMNPHYGNPMAKNLIPQFRVELPDFWRMLYTLTNGESEIEIIAFVLDVMDHSKYDKKFGYKKS